MSVRKSSAGRAGADRLVSNDGGPGRRQVLVDFDALELAALADAPRLCPGGDAAEALGQRGRGSAGEDALELRVIGEGQLDLVACLPVVQPAGDIHRGNDLEGELVDAVVLVAANVEQRVASRRLERRGGDRRRDVLDVGEGAALLAIPEDGQRLALHQPVHEDPDHVAVLVAQVLAFAIDVVRPKDDIVQAEEFMARLQLELDRRFRDAVGILGKRGDVLTHGQLVGAVDGDRRGEGKAADLVVDAGVDQVDAAEQVVGVVEALDEVAEALRRVGGQVIDVVEAVAIEQPVEQLVVDDRTLDEAGAWIDVFLEAPREVVEHDDVEAKVVDQVVDDVRADEARASGDECGCHLRFLHTICGAWPRRRRGTMSKKSPATSSKEPAASAVGGEIGRAWPVVASTGAAGAGVTVAAETMVAGWSLALRSCSSPAKLAVATPAPAGWLTLAIEQAAEPVASVSAVQVCADDPEPSPSVRERPESGALPSSVRVADRWAALPLRSPVSPG